MFPCVQQMLAQAMWPHSHPTSCLEILADNINNDFIMYNQNYVSGITAVHFGVETQTTLCLKKASATYSTVTWKPIIRF